MGMNNLEHYLRQERHLEKCVEVKHGLHSFLFELGRCSKTSGCHYVISNGNIIHHNDTWRVIVWPPYIFVISDRSLAIDTNGKMLLIDDYAYEEVSCVTAPGYIGDFGNLYEDAVSLLQRIVEAYHKYIRRKQN